MKAGSSSINKEEIKYKEHSIQSIDQMLKKSIKKE
jgi:hypothetical protein